MSFQNIQFRQLLRGHSGDVRSIAVSEDDKFIATISRDNTCKFWRLNNNEYENYLTFGCSDQYALTVVYCAYSLSENAQNSSPLVLIGGLDCIVSMREIKTGSEKLKISGHAGAVASILIVGCEILTGSWDTTIKHWRNDGSLLRTLGNHTASVWCLSLIDKEKYKSKSAHTQKFKFLSGSADTSIILWDNFSAIMIFKGHTGPVRDLMTLNTVPGEFISCSNDGSIKRWRLDTEKFIDSAIAHNENFVYSISSLGRSENSGHDVFVTSGEENVIRIWEGFKLVNEIAVPSKTNWCVRAFSSGGFVLGSAYTSSIIFGTNATDRNPVDYEEFQLLVSACAQSSGILKGVDITKLEDVETGTKNPGKSDGQVKMLRNGEQILIYEWVIAQNEWRLLGNALREVDAEESKSSKMYYKGAEYDYVIDVDVEGGKMLKLPYNNGEDPAIAAARFIEDHSLAAMYQDQIVEFLKANIPSAASYENPSKNIPAVQKTPATKFPILKPILFSKTNVKGLFNRLNSSNLLNDGDSIILQQFLEYSCEDNIPDISIETLPIESLNFLFNAGANVLTPLLDMIKQLVLFEKFFYLFFINSNNHYKLNFINFIKKFTEEGNDSVVHMLSLKIFCNSFKHKKLYSFLIEYIDDVIYLVTCMHLWTEARTQISIASLVFNYTAIFHVLKFSKFDKIVQLLESLIWVFDAMLESLDEESLVRILSSIGNILYLPNINSEHLKTISKNLDSSIQRCPASVKIDSLKEELLKKLRLLS